MSTWSSGGRWEDCRRVKLAGKRWRGHFLTRHRALSRHNKALTLDSSVILANEVNPVWVGFSKPSFEDKDIECVLMNTSQHSSGKNWYKLLAKYLLREDLPGSALVLFLLVSSVLLFPIAPHWVFISILHSSCKTYKYFFLGLLS